MRRNQILTHIWIRSLGYNVLFESVFAKGSKAFSKISEVRAYFAKNFPLQRGEEFSEGKSHFRIVCKPALNCGLSDSMLMASVFFGIVICSLKVANTLYV